MENKQMIDTAISMLKGIDPKTIEVINFDRTAYDDGSVGFSVNITTPATHKGSPIEDSIEQNGAYREMDKLADFILKEFPQEPGRDGRNESAADVAIRLLEQLKPAPVFRIDPYSSDMSLDEPPEYNFNFRQLARYAVIDFGDLKTHSPSSGFFVPNSRELKITGPLLQVYLTDNV